MSILSKVVKWFYKPTPIEAAINALEPVNKFEEDLIEIVYKHGQTFPDKTQISMGLLQGDQPYYYGVVREDKKLLKIENNQSVFEIGSITKLFTAAILCHLVEKNKVHLDAPLTDYLDFKIKNDGYFFGVPITLKMLANHTSGLPRLNRTMKIEGLKYLENPYKNYSEEKLIHYLKKKLKVKSKPGQHYLYSNLGGGLLGYMLEKITNEQYEVLLQEYICEHLQMLHTTTDISKIQTLLVEGRNNEKIVQNWEYQVLKGAGAIKSSAKDMIQFLKAHFNNDVAFNLLQDKTFSINSNMDMAMGWHILKNENGIYFHNGGTGGYTACIAFKRSTKKGVVVLTNLSAFSSSRKKVDDLCLELMKWI